MGEPWPSVPPSVYEEALDAACAGLGVARPEAIDPVCPPDPWAAAFLLAEVGGRLVRRGEEVYLVAPAAALGSPLLRALRSAPDGWVRINP